MAPSSRKRLALLASLGVVAACGGSSAPVSSTPSPVASATPTPTPTPTTAQGTWQLAWADEFNDVALLPGNWTALNDCWGGGNEERQCYTPRPENVALENGLLVITARREDWTGPAFPASFGPSGVDMSQQASKPFTSGKLTTQGHASWTYGRFEMRARFPQGQGVWPAFWMLPEESHYGPWAASGEIDILEIINPGVICPTCEPGGENSIFGTLHFGGQWPNNAQHSQGISFPAQLDGEFHTYGVIWEQGRFTWTVDGQPYARATAADWFTSATTAANAPFDRPFHLILNLAIGGRWPEENALTGISEDNFPKRMEVDWVRVWQCDADPATGRGCNGG